MFCKAISVFCLLLGWTTQCCNGRRVGRNKASRRFSTDNESFGSILTSTVSRKNQVVELGSFEGKTLGVRHYTSKSKASKSCKSVKGSGKDEKGAGKGKVGKGVEKEKGHTCAPSAESFSAPSISMAPSVSAAPSYSPSVSGQPSSMPTPEPSLAPSVEPMQDPSTFSSSPLASFSPSAPSEHHSSSTTLAPTSHLSSQPGISSRPSTSSQPSLSLSPTGRVFTTNTFPEGFESTCDYLPPSNLEGTLKPQRLVFLYYMYVQNGTENVAVQGKIREMEQRIHNGLVAEFLKCDACQDAKSESIESFYIWSISSSPADDFSPEGCVQEDSNTTVPPPENSECVSVQSNLGMIAFFPARDRALPLATDADPLILEATGEYLEKTMQSGDFDDDVVLQSRFKGFVMPGDPSSGPNVAAANQQLQSNKQQSRIGAGATAMALACLCLLAVVLLTVHRRKRRAELYLQHLEDMSSGSDLYKDGVSVDLTTYIVGDASFDRADGHENPSSMDDGDETPQGHFDRNVYQHDVHQVCIP